MIKNLKYLKYNQIKFILPHVQAQGKRKDRRGAMFVKKSSA